MKTIVIDFSDDVESSSHRMSDEFLYIAAFIMTINRPSVPH